MRGIRKTADESPRLLPFSIRLCTPLGFLHGRHSLYSSLQQQQQQQQMNAAQPPPLILRLITTAETPIIAAGCHTPFIVCVLLIADPLHYGAANSSR